MKRTYLCDNCGSKCESSSTYRFCGMECKRAYYRDYTKHIVIDPETQCWNWQGQRVPDGYGVLGIGYHENGKRQFKVAHRYVYELLRGPVPEGLVLDHLCRNTQCVNPDHLEPVTTRENIIRGLRRNQYTGRTHCSRGHEYTPKNTRLRERDGRVSRTCLTCHYEDRRKAKAVRRDILRAICAGRDADERRAA